MDTEYSGYMYFARAVDGTAIKIVYSLFPEHLVRNLVWNGPVTLLRFVPGDVATERRLHRLCYGYRLHGEWFHPSIVDLISPIIQRGYALDSDDGPLETRPIPRERALRTQRGNQASFVIHVRVTPELYEDVRRCAAAERRTLSSYMARVLEDAYEADLAQAAGKAVRDGK